MTKRKQFTSEFKREAVSVTESSEKPSSEVARELGVRRNQLYKWKEQLDERGAEHFPAREEEERRAMKSLDADTFLPAPRFRRCFRHPASPVIERKRQNVDAVIGGILLQDPGWTVSGTYAHRGHIDCPL